MVSGEWVSNSPSPITVVSLSCRVSSRRIHWTRNVLEFRWVGTDTFLCLFIQNVYWKGWQLLQMGAGWCERTQFGFRTVTCLMTTWRCMQIPDHGVNIPACTVGLFSFLIQRQWELLTSLFLLTWAAPYPLVFFVVKNALLQPSVWQCLKVTHLSCVSGLKMGKMFWVKWVNFSSKDTMSSDQVLTAAFAKYWH